MKLGATALREVEMQKFASNWREVGGLLGTIMVVSKHTTYI